MSCVVSISSLGLHKALATGQLANAERRIEKLLALAKRQRADLENTIRELAAEEQERAKLQRILEATEE